MSTLARGYRVVVIALICHVVSAGAASSGPPIVESDRIIFANGRELHYEQEKVLYQNPDAALRAGKPVSVEEHAMLIARWERLLLVKTEHLFEDRATELRIFDYEGDLQGRPYRFVGDVLVLEGVGRIVLAQQSSHQFLAESFLVDRDGELVARLPQPRDVIRIAPSDDEALIWILSSTYSNDIPATRVEAFDSSNGRRVSSAVKTRAGDVTVDYKGQEYRLAIQDPDVPG